MGMTLAITMMAGSDDDDDSNNNVRIDGMSFPLNKQNLKLNYL